MNKPIKYIVSGNYNEYQAYVRSKPRDKYYYKYVSGTERLCGLSSIEGYYIGTYMDRPDIDEIKVRIAMIKSKQKIDAIEPLQYQWNDSGTGVIAEELIKSIIENKVSSWIDGWSEK